VFTDVPPWALGLAFGSAQLPLPAPVLQLLLTDPSRPSNSQCEMERRAPTSCIRAAEGSNALYLFVVHCVAIAHYEVQGCSHVTIVKVGGHAHACLSRPEVSSDIWTGLSLSVEH